MNRVIQNMLFVLLLCSGALFAQSLKVTSFPDGANVSIDGADTGKVTPMSTSVSLGAHTVIVSIPNSGWNADTRTLTVESGTNYLSVTLLPRLTIGPQGSQGPKGDTGAQGPKGDPGKDGVNGLNGAPGKDGVNGLNGKDGAPGKDGTDGTNGAQGLPGDPGPKGDKGDPCLPSIPGCVGPAGPAASGVPTFFSLAIAFDQTRANAQTVFDDPSIGKVTAVCVLQGLGSGSGTTIDGVVMYTNTTSVGHSVNLLISSKSSIGASVNPGASQLLQSGRNFIGFDRLITPELDEPVAVVDYISEVVTATNTCKFIFELTLHKGQ